MRAGMWEGSEAGETASVDARGIKPPPAFALLVEEPSPAVTAVRLEGELDLAATEALRAAVEAADGRALVLDLRRVTFVDSAMLKELLRARAELSARGVRLVLAGVPRTVRRLFELTRTEDLFETAPDMAAALEQV
jgi:anti-sigma B factor antagonist